VIDSNWVTVLHHFVNMLVKIRQNWLESVFYCSVL